MLYHFGSSEPQNGFNLFYVGYPWFPRFIAAEKNDVHNQIITSSEVAALDVGHLGYVYAHFFQNFAPEFCFQDIARVLCGFDFSTHKRERPTCMCFAPSTDDHEILIAANNRAFDIYDIFHVSSLSA